jgi:putative FmdB family regulatory protein
MHDYDFRCKDCRTRFTVTVATYAEYDALTPACPSCGSEKLSRLITGVAIPRSGRDFTKLSSDEMLNVFESGDSRQVGQMFQQFGDQFGGASPDDALPYHDAAKQLMAGKSMDTVERNLAEATGPASTTSADD